MGKWGESLENRGKMGTKVLSEWRLVSERTGGNGYRDGPRGKDAEQDLISNGF